MDASSLPLNDAASAGLAAPGRMERLAKLPVFWDLEDRDVLLVGASDAVAWKAELVAACGARVHVYLGNATPSRNLTMLAADQGRIFLYSKSWRAADLSAFALLIAACDDDAEARALHDAARAAGVPVNIIDRPDFCQFQFGSIVNRSPVVVAISTDGAAPILAQAIRRRIETLLPPALKGWAELARRLRNSVAASLEAGAPRRAFWEHFVDMAFGGNAWPDSRDEAELAASIDRLASLGGAVAGGVTFVGAGPGDAEFMTLKAVRTLQAADVIFYDRDVGPEVLELARREAKRLFVGADAGHCEAMRNLAKTGKRVVRLSMGEGAGSEDAEARAMIGSGIDVAFVRGVRPDIADAQDVASRDAPLPAASRQH